MRREDFIFTIGYDGDSAIVDRKSKKRYGKLSTAELAEAGLLRAAFCSALHAGDPAQLDRVLEAYNAGEGTAYGSPEDLKRLFGVYEVRQDITKVKAL